MAQDGKEPVSSMGTDIPLAVLSRRSQILPNYFKQLFAQVTNPPIDPIREKVVMSTESLLGSEQNLLDESPEHARLLRLKSPTLSNAELARLRAVRSAGFHCQTLSILFDRTQGEAGLAPALDRLCAAASQAVDRGATILILSDRDLNADLVPVPPLLATAAVHHHLIRKGQRTRCGIVVETGEAREIHHFALLIGYGAGAVNPYLVALVALHDTNNFPEFTGKTCPAPCEASCVLALNGAAVTIKDIEAAIVDCGWEMGWIVARPPARETGKSVAIAGSGPAGLAAAQQLRRAGHTMTVYERDDRAGGLLAYGIPDFKMAKVYVERRIDQHQYMTNQEGVFAAGDCRRGQSLGRVGHCRGTGSRPAYRSLPHGSVQYTESPRPIAGPDRAPAACRAGYLSFGIARFGSTMFLRDDKV